MPATYHLSNGGTSTTVRLARNPGWTVQLAGARGAPGPAGPAGAPGGSDAAFAGWVNDTASATRGALDTTFAGKNGPLLLGTPTTSTLLNRINNLPASGGFVRIEDDVTMFDATLELFDRDNVQIVAEGSSCVFQSDAAADRTLLKIIDCQQFALRGVKVLNAATGARTAYDIDIVNPTKPVLEDVEINLPDTATGAGGIRIRKDTGVTGNSFMPQLARVWIRNGRLILNQVTDGHFIDGFVWAHNTAGAGAVEMTQADGWTFSGVDLVPVIGAAGYKLTNTNHTKLIGGYLDGSYDALLTGHGIHAVNSGRLFVSGTNFYNLGRSGVRLENTHGSTFTAAGFYRGNKADGSHPDIDLYGSTYNTFLGTSHSQPATRTNKGAIYREDATSFHNLFDAAVLDQSLGNQYGTPLFSGNSGTLGRRNRPGALWSRPTGVQNFVVPQGATVSPGATATWPLANRAYLHRFNLDEGATFRYARLRIEATSGNMQVAVVRLDGLNYTRVMNSGVIATPAGAATATVDLGSTFLQAGEYALAVWFDNTTASVPMYNGGEAFRAYQLTTDLDIVGGVALNGTLTNWSGARSVCSLSLTT